MARVLLFRELKKPGTGYLELLDCECPEHHEPLAVPCVWLDENATMTDNSFYYHVDPDEPRYSVISRSRNDYNNISKSTLIAWRIWDSQPTKEEMYSKGWNESKCLVQPTLYFRGDPR